MPANAIDLWQREQAAKCHAEHSPETFLECLRLYGFDHFVLADHALGWDDTTKIGCHERRTGNIRQHDPVSPWKDKPALVWRTRLANQRGITPKQIGHSMGTLPSLL